MRYSIELREKRYVKGYGFLSFAKNIDTQATKVAKNLNNKYGQKLALKITGKRAIQKTAEASADLVGNFIANKITSISKKPTSEPHSNAASNEIPKERSPCLHKRDKKLLMN